VDICATQPASQPANVASRSITAWHRKSRGEKTIEICILERVFETNVFFFFFHHVHGRIPCVEDEYNYHTGLRYERISYLNGAGLTFKYCEFVRKCITCIHVTRRRFPNYSLSMLYFCQILEHFFVSLVVSLEGPFFFLYYTSIY